MKSDVLMKRALYEADGVSVSAWIDPWATRGLEDVQSHRDHRAVPIEQVGVSDLRYPISVLDRAAESQRTIASITLSVGLPQDTKGTHMSRFIAVLERHRGEITVRTLPEVLRDLKTTLEAESARIEVRFPYFLERRAPVSGVPALVDYQCAFVGEMNGGDMDFVLGVDVPVTSLCPCSKAISDYGAHNQRGVVRIETRSTGIIWIEELIEIAESSASTPVYALLKREDERHLTMQAYDNPVFVEDMVRNAAVRLRTDARVTWFRVRAENHESIHNHNAFAQVSCFTRKA
ncbi:MAG: GTP cyclohydrolase FolE2 [Chromatiaceae bacterium]|jgi:GTP cyclohydrolase I|nr:GTP cyclohydrolase FolE2 [Chromatiaceae bacterium]